MLYNLFQEGFSREALISILLTLPVILIALTVHELSHGYAAYKLGDPTAYQFGRLTLNPTKHLDPIGTLMMVLFGFGWARPVPVNSRYFKKPRRDMAITAIAGPLSNILLCFFGYFVFRVYASFLFPSLSIFQGTFFVVDQAAMLVSYTMFAIGGVKGILLLFLYYFFYLNVTLAVFNLIPIPPLDGSRLLSVCLPPHLYFKLMKYERYIVLAIIAALWFGFLSTPLYYAGSAVVWVIEQAIGWLPFLR